MSEPIPQLRSPNNPPSTHVEPIRPHRLSIEFTGSGSEYFRIWIVNLLLILVTLGLYYPWAKVRRLRYFRGSTLVGGEPLDFHGDPKKMLKGYLLVAVLFGLYSAAGNFSPMAGFIAFLIVAAIWPALLKSSMQFQMANTSWRGMRFRFIGSVPGAYRALLPFFLSSVVILGALMATGGSTQSPIWFGMLSLVVILVVVAGSPWLLWNLKRYQHNHYALATLQTSFRATLGSIYKLCFKSLGILVLASVLAGGAVALLIFGMKTQGSNLAALSPAVALIPLALMMLLLVLLKPYFTARLQNEVWTRTGNSSLRFRSALKVRSLTVLTLKNWLLMLLTLGLYWPFAAVATARLRLQSVRVETKNDPQELVNHMQVFEGDAAGDAAGDFLGFDIGL
jgi:uncharacterized membrane protein YjgN (DUF898 family)